MNDEDKKLVERAMLARNRMNHAPVFNAIGTAIRRCETTIEKGTHPEIEDARHDLRLIASMGGVPKEEIEKAFREGVQMTLEAWGHKPLCEESPFWYRSRAKRVMEGVE